MIYLAICFDNRKVAGRLCEYWTGLPAYHCGFVSDTSKQFYDMHLIMRRRNWPLYGPDCAVSLIPVPLVTEQVLENALSSESNTYGWLDYLLFSLRKVYHLFGKSTPNAKGVICSELCNNILRNCGYTTPWGPGDAPPSPADLYRHFS